MRVFYFREWEGVENKWYDVVKEEEHIVFINLWTREYWVNKINCFTDEKPMHEQINEKACRVGIMAFWKPWSMQSEDLHDDLMTFKNYLQEQAVKFANQLQKI